MDYSRVAIVILNWNGRAFLGRFLPGVISLSPRGARIIVADNASQDDSLAFVRATFPQVEIIELDRNYGFAGGYNRALEQVEADYYVLLNSDIGVSAAWVEPIIGLMEQQPDVAACQPRIRAYDRPSHFEHAGGAGGFIDHLGYPFCRGRIFDEVEPDLGQYDDVSEVFWATGACLFVRATAFHGVGGFDPRFFAHMEEIDLCWRLKNKGHRIMVCPQSTVYHVGGGTLHKSNPRKTFLNFRNSLWMLAKNLPRRAFYRALVQRAVLDLVAAMSFLAKGRSPDMMAVIRAWGAFLGSFRHMRGKSRRLPASLPSRVYRGSIVWDYHAGKKRHFRQLDPEHFTTGNQQGL